ncbi:MAG TPA: ADYC domain-containing protein [Xanthobacteraceae bacterium]
MRTALGLHGALAVLAVLAAAVAAPARAGDEADRAASPVASIAVEGTVLKITLADGRVLASRDLIGASLLVDQGDRLRRVRLDGIERDPEDKRRDVAPADVIWLHSFAVEGPDGAWGPLCEDGPDGRRQAISVAGRFSHADGRLGAGEPGSFELACTAGAMGKCVRFGYHPWQTRNLPQPVSHHDGEPAPSQLDLFNACIRMVRADYGGDGTGTTRNGMLIDLYDDYGIQAPDLDHRMTFEAGWTQDGAVCVNHPRVKENISLGEIAARWRRPAGRTGASCTEEAARSLGALLFNRSTP